MDFLLFTFSAHKYRLPQPLNRLARRGWLPFARSELQLLREFPEHPVFLAASVRLYLWRLPSSVTDYGYPGKRSRGGDAVANPTALQLTALFGTVSVLRDLRAEPVRGHRG